MSSLLLHVGSNSYSYRYVHCVAVIAKNSSNYEVVEPYLCFSQYFSWNFCQYKNICG